MEDKEGKEGGRQKLIVISFAYFLKLSLHTKDQNVCFLFYCHFINMPIYKIKLRLALMIKTVMDV